MVSDLLRNYEIIASKIKMNICSEDDLKRVLTIRDKLCSLALEVVSSQINKISVIQVLKRSNPQKYDQYFEGYMLLINFFLREAVRKLNVQIRNWCGIRFPYPHEYDEVGYFYKPTTSTTKL